MSDLTKDTQKNSAIQGLLALRDCDSGDSPKSDSNSILTTPELHPNANPNLILQSNYCIPPPFDSSINPRFNQEMNRLPKLSYVSSQSMKPLENRAYYHHQDFNYARRSNQLIYSPQKSKQKVTLPPIKDMIAQYPLSHHHQRRSSTNVLPPPSPRAGFSGRHVRALATHPYARKNSVISLALLNQHNKSQTPEHGLLNLQSSLRDHQNLAYQNDPDSFFDCLKQPCRPEFENEPTTTKEHESQSNTDSVETQETESDNDDDDDDDGSVYKPSSSSSGYTPTTQIKKVAASESKGNRHSEKPRWTTKEKKELFEAVVRHKSLDIMATFDWNAIGNDIGRVDKACKDQWRRGILKMFREYICKL
ncbi:hypothetical protein HPULCUR_007998 [Helicostylum pulchrum]|uniref:Myb-like domain-containing protein n=1 Tax=Helicostylum pulchrum TaxID=562976 RepID=A0ABP9Y6E0_9FUNG